MAGIRKIYTSQNEYLEDVAASSNFFDAEYYETAKEAGQGLEYLSIIAGTKDQISSSFDNAVYDRLSGADRFNYYVTENLLDKSSEDYKTNSTYFTQKIQQIKNQETYEGLNGFQKTINSIGGFLGNAFVQLGGIVEGLIDVGASVVGAFGDEEWQEKTKEFIAKDTTGYNATQQAMNDWISANTFIDKNVVTRAINDITTGIVRMTPMIVGGALAPYTGGVSAKIGTGVYYASMAGNTAEQAIVANPDIDYGDLIAYTGASVGLEAITEWASAKLFGDDVISSLMKGQKYAPTGSIIKNIAKNFGTEALEEATAELFGSMIYKALVDPTADVASFGDVFYAAIIGGLTGAVMSGGQVLTTKRMSVKDGKLVATSTLSKEQRKTAKQLGVAKSWGLNNLLVQAQQALQTTDEVTKLMAKYGTSRNNTMVTHQQEYQEALAKDTETKTQQAKAILDLANLMNTIGVEQFQRSAQLLNDNIEEARTMVDNYLNHTDQYNKVASAAFSVAYPGQTMTPAAQTTSAEQTLTRALRELYPELKVAFGTFGSEDGLAVKSINGTKGWLFIESGLVETLGYKQVLQQTIRNELSKSTMNELSKLPAEQTDMLVKLVTDDKTTYKDLSTQQKQAIAQMVCFDPVHNRRTFLGQRQTHKQLFKYITDQAEYVKNFARKTEANTIRYAELLKIRNTFLNSIAETIDNTEDVAFVQNEYGLTDEENKTKIIDKTTRTSLNAVTKIINIDFSKDAIFKREAIDSLMDNRLDTTVDFDYARIYDESYYNPEWVAQIKQQQQTQDFEQALKIHLDMVYKTTLEDRDSFIASINENISEQDTMKVAEIILTKEFLDGNPDFATIQNAVADTLYTMVATEVDQNMDSVVEKDGKLQGTGKIKFFKGDVYDRNNIVDTERRRVTAKGAEGQLDRVVSRSRKYIQKQIDDLLINTQAENTLDEYQKELIKITKQTYGLDVEFYSGPIKQINVGDKNTTLGFVVTGTNKVYVRDDSTVSLEQIVLTIRHEVTHKLIEANDARYKQALKDLQDAVGDEFDYWAGQFARDENYGINYPHIDEEVVVGYLTGWFVAENSINQLAIDEIIKEFYYGTESMLWTDEIWSLSKLPGQIKMAKKTKPKTNKVANQILKQFEDGAKSVSETQFSDSSSKEYSQVSYDMIDTMADTFALVNDDNYDEIRNSLKKSNKKYSAQALEIFDLYTIEMVGKFNTDIRQKIENIYQKLQTEAGQRLALQAKRVATRKPISHTISTLARDGFNTTVTDEIVQKYDAKLKDKDAYIKELQQKIKDLESQIQKATSQIEKTALSKELKEVSDKKGVIESGSNADILDYVVTHASTLEQAAKIQEDVLDKLLATAVVAQEEGKKVGYYVYDQDGKLKPFPEASQKIAKTLKKLKSFRMWSMLSSPVTWVRNWMGNQGMRGLDAMTNFVEGFLTSRTGFDQGQMKFTETRAGKELYDYIAKSNESYIMSLVRGEDVKYETSAEKAAELKRKERKIEYESANAFKKACLKAQDMTDWGLSTGPLGDEPVVFNSICKNMGNLVANNVDFLLQGIQQEANALNKQASLGEKSQERLKILNKALQTKDAKDVFNALSKEETERLFDICKERSFQQYFKNPNALSKWFAKFGTKHPVAAELVSWVMPFPKVAANVLSMAYRYSPLNFFNGIAELSKYRQTQRADYKGPITGFEKAQMIRTFSEASVGTFMLIAGAIFSAMGLIDIDEDDYLGPCIKIGDFKISLSDLAPSMTTFSTASAVVWSWKNDKSAITQALNVLYDNTLLGNVENLLTYGSFTDIVKNVSVSYISQYIPAILKLVNKATTGGVKKDKSGNYLQRVIKTLGSYIPGVSQLVPNKIDPYTGKKVYQAGVENWFLNLLATISPLGVKWDSQSELQRQAEALGIASTGLSGKFKVNDKDYSVENKEKYAKYRAEYIESQFNSMLSGEQNVTVEDENGKRVTTTYDKLTDKQKKNVINRLYTEATSMTKIKWWTDQGNKYVVTDSDQYNEYRKMFNNIIYKKTWTKSKFMES